MNAVHAAIVKHLREKEGIAEQFANKSDEEIVRLMFANFRGRDRQARGMRLTNHGLQVMRKCFKGYEINLVDEHELTSTELLYLDSRASLPYHLMGKKVTLFEDELACKLKLADGDIRTLIEIEGI